MHCFNIQHFNITESKAITIALNMRNFVTNFRKNLGICKRSAGKTKAQASQCYDIVTSSTTDIYTKPNIISSLCHTTIMLTDVVIHSITIIVDAFVRIALWKSFPEDVANSFLRSLIPHPPFHLFLEHLPAFWHIQGTLTDTESLCIEDNSCNLQ